MEKFSSGLFVIQIAFIILAALLLFFIVKFCIRFYNNNRN